ncbi:MAG: hypothetical protein HYY97_13120 [Rhodocyclales bacterium]|nr:hypothetical protein [Rhodocyclales bacterium]
MRNRSLPMLAVLLALTGAAGAQAPVESVGTDGYGELRRASEAMITPTMTNISIRIPGVINKGEVIYIEYEADGNKVADSFMVTGITLQGEGCAIESRRTAPDGPTVSDVIQVRSCRKLK